jgi:hypothetical protein
MDKDDDYRKQAAEAQKWADCAINPADKEAWLGIAQRWLSLISKRQPTAQEQFDEGAKAKGTGQNQSKSSP